MNESNGFGRTLEHVLAIIVACVTILAYFNIKPNNSTKVSKSEVEIVNSNNSDKKHVNIITVKSAQNISLGELLLIPFVEHESGNYFKIIERKYPIFSVIVWLFYLFFKVSFILMLISQIDFKNMKWKLFDGGISTFLMKVLCFMFCTVSFFYFAMLFGDI